MVHEFYKDTEYVLEKLQCNTPMRFNLWASDFNNITSIIFQESLLLFMNFLRRQDMSYKHCNVIYDL